MGSVIKEKEKRINIIYASNDGYAGHLGASLFSLLENNRQLVAVDIYILSVGMCTEFQQRLKAIAASFGRRLFVIELGNLMERFPYDVDTRGFDISAMGRLFAQDVLPEAVHKALYLDCDTIVCGSIDKLYGTELETCLAGMIMEPTVYKEMKESIGFRPEDPYFNSGVILMNLEQWRREQVLKTLLDFYGAHRGSLFACDQDTLNGALKGRIKSLPPKYNFFTNYRYFRYKTLTSLCRAYETVGWDAFYEAKRFPVILHYLGDERPWIAGNHNHYRKLYWWYLSRTPWKGMRPQEGKRLYMHLWWGFNQTTRIFPAVRLFISRRLGMKVIDSRKNRSKK